MALIQYKCGEAGGLNNLFGNFKRKVWVWVCSLKTTSLQSIRDHNKKRHSRRGNTNFGVHTSETRTFFLLTFCEPWGRSTQTPSALFWHNTAVAATGQMGSHDSVSSRGSKLIPDHSSPRPAGDTRWSQSFQQASSQPWNTTHPPRSDWRNRLWTKINQVTHGV